MAALSIQDFFTIYERYPTLEAFQKVPGKPPVCSYPTRKVEVMHIEGMDLDLEVQFSAALPADAVRQAACMVRAVLPKGTNANGRWLLRFDGVCNWLVGNPALRLEITRAELGIVLNVAVRSTRKDDPLLGTLRLAPGINPVELLQEVAPVLERFNQGGWQEVLAAAPPLQPLTCTVLPSKGDTVNSLSVVRAESYTDYGIEYENHAAIPPPTLRIGTIMLQHLLYQAAAPMGDYRVKVIGFVPTYDSLRECRVELTHGRDPSAIMVKVRARYGAGGNFSAYLYVPSGADRNKFGADLETAAEYFSSDDGWNDVLSKLAPGGRPDRGNTVNPRRSTSPSAPSSATPPVFPVVASPAPTPKVDLSPDRVQEARAAPASEKAPPVPAKAVPAPTAPAAPAATPSLFDGLSARDEKLARALLAVLNRSRDRNGVFISGNLTTELASVLPEEKKRGWAMIILKSLRDRGWCLRLPDRTYQVSAAFAQQFSPGTTLTPLSVTQTPQPRRKSVPQQPPRSFPGTNGNHSLEVLLARREELEAQIVNAVRDKERLLEQELAAAEAAVTSAQEAVTRAQTALTAHRQKYALTLEH